MMHESNKSLSTFNKIFVLILFALFFFAQHSSLILANQTSAGKLFIFSLNDLHGYADESNSALGFAKFVTGLNEYKKNLGATANNSLVVAAGDMYQGGFLSNISYGDIVSPFLKSIKVKVCALGNHDLDWGIKHLRRWERDGGFEFLSSNIRSGSGESICKAYKIFNISGYKIAFLGLTTVESQFTIPYSTLKNIGGVHFDDPTQTTKELIQKIRSSDAPDYIIALVHMGAMQDSANSSIYGEIEALSRIEGIDAIIAGHTHTKVAGFLNKKPVIEACSYGKCIGALEIDTKNHTIKPMVKDLYAERASLLPNKNIDDLIKANNLKYQKEINTVLSVSSNNLDYKSLSKYFVKKIFDDLKNDGKSVDAVIINGGLFRTKINKGDSISYKTIKELIPFDNTLVFVDISGSDLAKAIHHTQNMPNQRKEGAFYTNISNITHNKYYKVAISSFMYPNGDWYDFSNAKNVFDTQTLLSDLMLRFVREYGI